MRYHVDKLFFRIGEEFFTDVGYLEAATEIYDDFAAFTACRKELDKQGFECLKESGETLANILPFLNLPKDATVHYQQPINKKYISSCPLYFSKSPIAPPPQHCAAQPAIHTHTPTPPPRTTTQTPNSNSTRNARLENRVIRQTLPRYFCTG